jgi:hypothetical protein
MFKKVIYVANARSNHIIDWYRAVSKICGHNNVFLLTDQVDGGGFIKVISDGDNVELLFNIDKFLYKRQTAFNNIWRNILKIFALPIMAYRLHKIYLENKDAVFHAHSMFYIFLCWAARIPFIATPMGSDVLVRPKQSKLYKFFTKLSLRAAQAITLDSQDLANAVFEISGASSLIVQNGIDAHATKWCRESKQRDGVVSLRAMDPNYQIHEIVKAHKLSKFQCEIQYIYPFLEEGYKQAVVSNFSNQDIDSGRLDKAGLYKLLSKTHLAISIPVSDSSPRSVYEAIFSGCAVAVTESGWVDELPTCMRARIITVSLDDDQWFDKAIEFSKRIVATPFSPSQEAISKYDEFECMKHICQEFYVQI